AEAGSATQETLQSLRAHFGLDVSVAQQLLNYISNLSHFNLGISPRHNMPVTTLIGARFISTLVLMTTALSIALLIGILTGAIMAFWSGKWPDRILSVLVLVLYSTPSFWLGLMAIVLFSVKLGW